MAKAKSLKATRATLNALLTYLIDETGRLPFKFSRISVVHDWDQDKFNARSPRAFCYTRPADLRIYCSKELESVDAAVRAGVLLHEIGHIVTKQFSGDECEVEVDAWVMNAVPEAGYRYGTERYENTRGAAVTAHNVQAVSPEFLARLFKEGTDGLR